MSPAGGGCDGKRAEGGGIWNDELGQDSHGMLSLMPGPKMPQN